MFAKKYYVHDFPLRAEMALRRRLWDAVYAMAEPFVKMPRSEKRVVVFVLAIMLYVWIAGLLGMDSRIVFGTGIGAMLGIATFEALFCRTGP
jgi:hypothetical protein